MSHHVIYARKSTESEDRQVLSIDSQIKELQGLALRRGLRPPEVLTEARSAKAPGRPVFGALMRRVSQGEIRGIICWKMDRLARNHLDTGAILQALADGKLQEVMTSDRTYTPDGNDRFMGNFELGMATKYIDDLRANVKRGNRARFQRGWVNYLPPLGYMNDRAAKTIVKDPDRFDLVRRMWELLLTGAYRPEQILKTANEEWGFRTRKFKRIGDRPLARSSLYRLFGDPFYMGLIRLKSGETFVGAHPPMLAKEEFDRAQEILGRPGRPRPKRHEFPFAGLIRCGACGAVATPEKHVKRSGREYVYYRCSRNRSGGICHEPPIPASHADEQTARVLDRLVIPEKTLGWILSRVGDTIRGEEERRASARRMLEDTLASVRREAETLLSLRLRDLVTDEQYLARKQALDERQRATDARLVAPAKAHEEIADLTVKTFQFGTRAARLFRAGTTVQRRMILEAVTSNRLLQGRKLLIQLKNPFRLIAEGGPRTDWCASLDDVRTWIRDTTEYFSIPDLANAGTLISPYKGRSVNEG
jgi:site-specific DNA recombinase